MTTTPPENKPTTINNIVTITFDLGHKDITKISLYQIYFVKKMLMA